MKTTLWMSVCNREYGDPLREEYPHEWRIDHVYPTELGYRFSHPARYTIPCNGPRSEETRKGIKDGYYPMPMCLWFRPPKPSHQDA